MKKTIMTFLLGALISTNAFARSRPFIACGKSTAFDFISMNFYKSWGKIFVAIHGGDGNELSDADLIEVETSNHLLKDLVQTYVQVDGSQPELDGSTNTWARKISGAKIIIDFKSGKGTIEAKTDLFGEKLDPYPLDCKKEK